MHLEHSADTGFQAKPSKVNDVTAKKDVEYMSEQMTSAAANKI